MKGSGSVQIMTDPDPGPPLTYGSGSTTVTSSKCLSIPCLLQHRGRPHSRCLGDVGLLVIIGCLFRMGRFSYLFLVRIRIHNTVKQQMSEHSLCRAAPRTAPLPSTCSSRSTRTATRRSAGTRYQPTSSSRSGGRQLKCCGSMTFWCGSGSGSGSADPCLWIMVPDSDLDPAIFVTVLQETNKNIF